MSGGFVEWLLRRNALAVARASSPTLRHASAELSRRGALALELADRTLDPVEPLRAGAAPFLAIELYRVAAYFHLAAIDPGNAPDLRRAWDACPEDVLLFAAAGPDGKSRLARAFFDSTFAEDAALPTDEQRRRAEDARAFVRALARRLESRDRVVGRVVWQRNLRVALMASLLASVMWVSSFVYARLTRPEDLVAGKHFEVSTTWNEFDPITRTVNDATVDLLFHTEEQKDPWIEFDLGAPTRIGSVEVTNRGDCCPERAVPLLIEASLDHRTYVEVARQDAAFRSWTATVAPREARWVRLRVPRKTWFHLAAVSIYAP